MAHRRSFLSAVTALGIALGMSVILAACTGAASPQPSASGGVAGVTASAGSAASASAPTASTGSAAASPSASAAASLSAQGAAEAAACSAIQSWSDEMRALVALDPSVASKDDVTAQVEKIKTAWFDVKSSLQNVEAADEAAVRDAGRSLENAVDDFQADVPLSDAIGAVRTAAEPLRATYKNMADGLGCKLTDPY